MNLFLFCLNGKFVCVFQHDLAYFFDVLVDDGDRMMSMLVPK